MTIGIGKFNRSSNFLGPGPKKQQNAETNRWIFRSFNWYLVVLFYLLMSVSKSLLLQKFPRETFFGLRVGKYGVSSHLFFHLTWTKPKRGCYYTGARSTWNYFVLLTKKCYYGKWKWPLQNMDFALHSLSQRNDHVLLRCTIFRFQKLWTVHKMEANPKRIFLKFPVM